MMDEIDIRNATEQDLPFIFATWLNHYKNHSSFARRIRKDTYMQHHHRVVSQALGRSTCDVSLATPKGDPEVLLGYLVKERWPDGIVVHFVYVKEAFRKLGIAKALMNASNTPTEGITFTHWTYDLDPIIKRYNTNIYNPYKI